MREQLTLLTGLFTELSDNILCVSKGHSNLQTTTGELLESGDTRIKHKAAENIGTTRPAVKENASYAETAVPT